MVVGLLCGVFGTHDANQPVHHLLWTPRTSIHRLVVVLLRRVLRWIVVCIRESESPNVTASASSHVTASVAASAASSVASSDNVPSDVEPSVHSHPWEAPMTTLLLLIVVLFRRAPCHPITAPIAASAATSDISYVASSATPYVAAFVEVPAAYPVKSHAAPSVACPATSSAE